MKELSNLLEAKNIKDNNGRREKVYSEGRLSYFQYANGKKFSWAKLGGEVFKYSIGYTGISNLIKIVDNLSNQVMTNANIVEDFYSKHEKMVDLFYPSTYSSIGNLFSSQTYTNLYLDSNALSVALVASSVFALYSLSERYKETVTFDSSKRALLIEGLTKDIKFEGIEDLMNKNPTSSTYRYLHMMNNIMLNNGGIEHKLISIKQGFSKMKNFINLTKSKALSNIFEVKFISKILGAKTTQELKTIYDEDIYQLQSLKSDYFKTMSFEMNFITPDISRKLSIIARKKKSDSGDPIQLIKELHSINQNSLEDSYHIDMDQKLALKFSKIIVEACKNNTFPKEELKKYEILSSMSTYKDSYGVIQNDVHIEISKMAKHFLSNERHFINSYKNKSLIEIISKIDNSMIKEGKISIKSFKDIFFLTRERYLNEKVFDTNNDLKNFISNKIKGVNIDEKDLNINIQNSNSSDWKKARKTLIKNNKI